MHIRNFLFFFALIFPSFQTNAQDINQVTVSFRNGSYSLQPGISRLISDSGTLDKSSFNHTYYLLAAFQSTPDRILTETLKNDNIQLLGYLQSNTYYISVPSGKLESLFRYREILALDTIPGFSRIDEHLNNAIPSFSIHKQGFVDVAILFFRTAGITEVCSDIEKEGGSILYSLPSSNNVVARLPVGNISGFAHKAWLMWMEPAYVPLAEENLPGRTSHRSNILAADYPGARNLTGKGIKIGEWDVGRIDKHIDLTDRLIFRETAQAVSTHSTHVCGTIAGAGIADPYCRGMASEATVYSWDYLGWIPLEMDSAYNLDKLQMTNNSYAYDPTWDTCKNRGYYDIISNLLDQSVNRHPGFLHIYAASNYQAACGAGGYRTISSGYQAAKNIIVTGAVDGSDGMSTMSSWGPMRDGRLKPDICAVGVNVKSTYTNNGYTAMSGTSSATPGVTGTLAQVIQRYKQIYSADPLASLIRAVVCNSAEDRGRPGPDYSYGFGRINGLRAVEDIEHGRFRIDSVSNGITHYDTIIVPPNTAQLKVILCWSDPAASPTIRHTARTLINDLDLLLKDTLGNSIFPFVLNPANPSANAINGTDTLNNIEQAIVNNPYAGKYIIWIKGTSVPLGMQVYSISFEFVQKGVTVTYPYGGEKLNPGTTETIRWDAAGIAGNFRVYYSLDSGTVWKAIDTNVNGTKRSCIWTVPDTSSATCLIMVRTSTGDTGYSDTLFSIMYTPVLSASYSCDSQITLTWKKTKQTSVYHVYHLANGKWDHSGYTADTFFTITGLDNKKVHWFSLTAENRYGAISIRSIGKNYFTDSTRFPPVITVQPNIMDTFCPGDQVILRTSVKSSGTTVKQWQLSIDQGITWKNINGANDTFISVSGLGKYQDRYQFRFSCLNSCKNIVYGNPAIINIDTGITFLKQPQDFRTCVGNPAIFRVSYIGKLPAKLFWQNSTDSGKTWNTLPGITDTFLLFSNVGYAQNQFRYRAIATEKCASDTSNTAVLQVIEPVRFLASSSKDTICRGDSALLRTHISGGDSNLFSFHWKSFGKGKMTMYVKPDTATDYIGILYDSCTGQTITDTIRIFVLKPLQVSLAATADTLCYGNSVKITATGFGGRVMEYDFLWLNDSTHAPSILDTPLVNKIYRVVLTDHCTIKDAEDSVLLVVRSVNSQWTDSIENLQVHFYPVFSNEAKYHWDFGDNDTSDLFSPVHVYPKSGNYLVCLKISDSFGCFAIYCDSIQVISTGLHCISKNDLTFNIFPNPGSGDFYIHLNNSGDGQYLFSVYTLLGINIFEKKDIADRGLFKLDLNHLPRGIYYLKVTGNNGYSVGKFMIK